MIDHVFNYFVFTGSDGYGVYVVPHSHLIGSTTLGITAVSTPTTDSCL